MPGNPKSAPGFVSLQDYLNANQGAVNNTGNALTSDASALAQKAQGEADNVYGEATNQAFGQGHAVTDPTSLADYAQAQSDSATAQQQLNGLSNFGGNSQQLQTKYGGTQQNYFGGGGNVGLDANLNLASGQGQAAQSKFGNLQSYLDGQVQRANTNFNKEAGTDGSGLTTPGGGRYIPTNAPMRTQTNTPATDNSQAPTGWVNPAMPNPTVDNNGQALANGGNQPNPTSKTAPNLMPWDGKKVTNWFANTFPIFGVKPMAD